MNLPGSVHPLALLAQGGGHDGQHDSLNPYLIGASGLFTLLLLLWITTRFNRDR
jgi:hypothetical protein